MKPDDGLSFLGSQAAQHRILILQHTLEANISLSLVVYY